MNTLPVLATSAHRLLSGARTRRLAACGAPDEFRDWWRSLETPPAPPLPALSRSGAGLVAALPGALAWCRHGIVCVVQDVRGRYGSDGTFAPYQHERVDGAATVD